jgi:hypothetical protein
MVFNATFNNISIVSWRSVLLMEETGVPGENTNLTQVTDKLYHNVVSNTLSGIQTHNVSGDRHWLHQGWFFFNYLTDFSYFSLKIVFRKLLNTVRTGIKCPFWKGVLMVSEIFHFFQLFYFLTRIIPVEQVVVNPTTIRSRPRQPPVNL